MKRALVGTTLGLLMMWANLAGAAEVTMTASPAVPAAQGSISFQHDRNHNTKFTVHAKHLARPDALTPAKSAYVVWTQPRGNVAAIRPVHITAPQTLETVRVLAMIGTEYAERAMALLLVAVDVTDLRGWPLA